MKTLRLHPRSWSCVSTALLSIIRCVLELPTKIILYACAFDLRYSNFAVAKPRSGDGLGRVRFMAMMVAHKHRVKRPICFNVEKDCCIFLAVLTSLLIG